MDLDYCIDKYNNSNKFNTKYKLIGMSTLLENSSTSEHYIACCLGYNEKYYYFNGNYICEILEENLYENEPYLLFYKRLDAK